MEEVIFLHYCVHVLHKCFLDFHNKRVLNKWGPVLFSVQENMLELSVVIAHTLQMDGADADVDLKKKQKSPEYSFYYIMNICIDKC